MRPSVLFPNLLFAVLLLACREHKPTPVPTPAMAASAPAVAADAAPAAATPAAAKPPAPAWEQREAEAAALRERVVLMLAIFGDKYNPVSNDAPMKLAAVDHPDQSMYAIEPVAHNFLPNGDAVLVANALAEDPGRRDGARIHTEGGLLNIFILRKSGGGWTLLKHHPNIARMGSWERIGKAEFVKLAAGKPGLAMRFGGDFLQFSDSAIALFDLGADPIRPLTGDGIALAASSRDCIPEHLDPCYEIAATWRFAASASAATYDDLVLSFTGQDDRKKEARRQGREGPVLASDITSHKGTARYAYDGKTYVLVEGKNPAQQD